MPDIDMTFNICIENITVDDIRQKTKQLVEFIRMHESEARIELELRKRIFIASLEVMDYLIPAMMERGDDFETITNCHNLLYDEYDSTSHNNKPMNMIDKCHYSLTLLSDKTYESTVRMNFNLARRHLCNFTKWLEDDDAKNVLFEAIGNDSESATKLNTIIYSVALARVANYVRSLDMAVWTFTKFLKNSPLRRITYNTPSVNVCVSSKKFKSLEVCENKEKSASENVSSCLEEKMTSG